MTRSPTIAKLPRFIYSYKFMTNFLWRTDLCTGEAACYSLASFELLRGSVWCELPGDAVIFSGGTSSANELPVTQVACIQATRDFEVIYRTPMLFPRVWHGAVYHEGSLYIIGGYDTNPLQKCEIFDILEDEWKAIEPLPMAVANSSLAILKESLYAIGGYSGEYLDIIQKLCLESLTWSR